MKYPKYYCKKCGELCRATKKPSKEFDSKTGKLEKPDYQLTCPNYRWYLWGNHFNERVSENINGDWFYDAGNELGPFYISAPPEAGGTV